MYVGHLESKERLRIQPAQLFNFSWWIMWCVQYTVDSCLVQFVLQTFPRCECDRLRPWTRWYQLPPTVRCEAWFGFCRRRTSDPVKFTKDLLRSMVNMLWTRLVSENGAQCLRMGEQMFMTLRDQGDPMNSQAAVRYEEGISKLVSRYDKCLSVQGDYVEK